ncbi:hypothetical protein [Streptomyces sp. NPDC002122]|uniref:hypothetical protein n=1 Tax=Streptomyces sp. NPDC002122 TaxID=3154407 RepID=UPI0033231CFF
MGAVVASGSDAGGQPIRRAAAEQDRPAYVNLWAGRAAALAQESPSAAAYLADLVTDARKRLPA